MPSDEQPRDATLSRPCLWAEARVILCVLVALLGAEFALRALEPRLSGNLRHIHDIPAIMAKIETAGKSLLFLGNSLTNNAVDPQAFQHLSSNYRAGGAVEKITPDGTALSDWYCIYQNHIATHAAPPEAIVLGFAWAQLSDQYPIDPVRLGGLFCRAADIQSLSSTGLSHHVNVLAFLAGAYSHVYLNREAIRNRVLDMLIPHYRDLTQSLNRIPDAEGADSGSTRPAYTYETLVRFIQDMAQRGTRLILVAMPVQDGYEIDPALIDVSELHGIQFLDMRHTPGIERTMFADPIHLNEEGRERFTAVLANRLARHQ